MKEVINISISGYLGTGSSALVDFLSEFCDVGIALEKNKKGKIRPYEHKLFYTSHGIVETSCLLKNANSAYSSDKIIANFYKKMLRFYRYDFDSFGSYKKLLGTDFLKIVNDYLKDLDAYKLESGISRTEHKLKVRFSPIMGFLQLGYKMSYKRSVGKFGKKNILDNEPFYFSMPSKSQVISANKNFTKKYLDNCYIEGKTHMVYDQLWNPSHSHLMSEFFDLDSFRSIVVLRDPRDVFIYSKYVWSKLPYGTRPPLPDDVEKFIDYWKKTTQLVTKTNKNLLIINFEDLVYKYDNTIKIIMSFLDIDVNSHTNNQKIFNPKNSINNTQIFKIKPEYKTEICKIEEELSEYLYDFPFEINNQLCDLFDKVER